MNELEKHLELQAANLLAKHPAGKRAGRKATAQAPATKGIETLGLSSATKAQIMESLEEKGIDHDPKLTKAELLSLFETKLEGK